METSKSATQSFRYCVWKRESERDRELKRESERERERETGRECVCMSKREVRE